MKNLVTKLAGFALLIASSFFSSQVVAQGTHNSGAEGLVLRVTINGVVTEYLNGACGYGTTATPSQTVTAWGGTVGANFCAPIQWGYGANQDTFGCSALPAGSLTGKIALIRRGGVPAACGFSVKALNAQNAGAIAVIIANHNLTATDNDCTILNMTGGPEAAQVTIPAYSICRAGADLINAGLQAGQVVEVCFLRPGDVTIPGFFFPASSKQTPVSQIGVDTFGFQAQVLNDSAATTTHTNVVVKASVIDLRNNNNVLYTASVTIPELAPGERDTVDIPGQYAPELPIGTYQVRYSATYDAPVGSTPVASLAASNFYVTQNLFAKDERITGAIRVGGTPATWGVGAMYTMSPKNLEKYRVKTVEFSFFADPAELAPADVEGDIYLFKLSSDVLPDYSNFEPAGFTTPSFEWVGIASYEAPATAQSYTLQQANLLDLNTANDGVELENGAKYVVAIEYSGSSSLTYHAFDTNTPQPAPSTLVYDGANWFLAGFTGGPSAIMRMYIDLVITTDETPLSETSMQIRPNPIVETLNLQVSFDEATDATITIADLTGRVITYENRDALTNDLLTYQLPQLASGTYLARIATKQGTLTKKFIVQK
ncbi:MAG: T9SS type A sorting domain-containing protein [Lewinellaceae bacterium]|nr:T9SS type A sorting domain-containing protein [Lewinellaceae bacterium]